MPERWIEKIVTSYLKINIVSADLPTAEDVHNYPSIAVYHNHFWMRPSDPEKCESVVYNNDNFWTKQEDCYHNMCPEDFAAVVPILKIDLLDCTEDECAVGDRFIFGGKEFIVVDAEAAVCTDDLGSSYYGFEEGEGYKVVKYEKSLPKFEVDTWFKRETSKP